MKIINWLFGNFIDNIKYKGDNKELIWKVPLEDKEIRYNATITIPKSYKVLIESNGIKDILNSGRYKLNLNTLKSISKELNWDSMSDEPFIANIYYIKDNSFKVKYKNDSSILIKDLRNHIINLKIEGSFNSTIIDSKLFLDYILNQESQISTNDITQLLEGDFLKFLPTVLANRVLPLSELLKDKEQLIDFLLISYNSRFNDIGIYIEELEIKDISYKKEKAIYTGIDTNKESESKNIYYIVKDSKESGPYSKRDIVWMLDNFEITSRTYIWREGLKKWIQIKDLMDFE